MPRDRRRLRALQRGGRRLHSRARELQLDQLVLVRGEVDARAARAVLDRVLHARAHALDPAAEHGVRARGQRLLLGHRFICHVDARQPRGRRGVRQLDGRRFELGDLLVEPVVRRRANLAESLGEAIGLRVRVGPRRGRRGPGAAEPGQPAAAARLALRGECGHAASPPVAVRWARPRHRAPALRPARTRSGGAALQEG